MNDSKELGSGSFGVVYLRDGKAVKVFNNLSCLIQEYSMLKWLSDTKHLVKALSVDFANKELTMELYQMNLRYWLQHHKNPRQLRQVLCDILLGLVELHDRGLVHCDLKPSNILVNLNPWKLVLGDCGFVTVAHRAKVTKTAAGFRDPDPVADFTHDVYSFGICISEIVCDTNRRISSKFYQDLIDRCTCEDKTKRPSVRELLSVLSDGTLPPRWQLPQLEPFDPKDPLYLQLKQQYKVSVSSRGKDNKEGKERFVRPRKIAIGLTMFFRSRGIHPDQYSLYLDVALLLTSSVFGGRKIRSKAIELSHQVRASTIYNILEQLADDSNFMTCIMSPIH